ncbi:p66 [Pistachio virus X]|uniref:p66 n=1 Tax=Pistachio virus X TaxID=2794236 RepID=A0A7T0Q884_9VIRU|nr:p66 [Pistachio virus X]
MRLNSVAHTVTDFTSVFVELLHHKIVVTGRILFLYICLFVYCFVLQSYAVLLPATSCNNDFELPFRGTYTYNGYNNKPSSTYRSPSLNSLLSSCLPPHCVEPTNFQFASSAVMATFHTVHVMSSFHRHISDPLRMKFHSFDSSSVTSCFSLGLKDLYFNRKLEIESADGKKLLVCLSNSDPGERVDVLSLKSSYFEYGSRMSTCFSSHYEKTDDPCVCDRPRGHYNMLVRLSDHEDLQVMHWRGFLSYVFGLSLSRYKYKRMKCFRSSSSTANCSSYLKSSFPYEDIDVGGVPRVGTAYGFAYDVGVHESLVVDQNNTMLVYRTKSFEVEVPIYKYLSLVKYSDGYVQLTSTFCTNLLSGFQPGLHLPFNITCDSVNKCGYYGINVTSLVYRCEQLLRFEYSDLAIFATYGFYTSMSVTPLHSNCSRYTIPYRLAKNKYLPSSRLELYSYICYSCVGFVPFCNFSQVESPSMISSVLKDLEPHWLVRYVEMIFSTLLSLIGRVLLGLFRFVFESFFRVILDLFRSHVQIMSSALLNTVLLGGVFVGFDIRVSKYFFFLSTVCWYFWFKSNERYHFMTK